MIAIPASVISDTPHLREKTSKIGLIGRTAAIFRVDEIIVFLDNPELRQDSDLDLVAALLSYIETPQYLRKKLFPIEQRLMYAGILPPLRTPHHTTSGNVETLKVGDYREGVVLSATKQGLLVDIGVGPPALLRDKQNVIGQRLTLQLVNVGDQIEVQVTNRSDTPDYWGYIVTKETSLKRVIESAKADLALGTSRKGNSYAKVEEQLSARWREADTVLVVLGSPTRGLNEIVAGERQRIKHLLDFVLNMIPCQGTETVRTEEALLATLAALNLRFAC